MSAHHPHGKLDNPDTVHEESDINVRAVIWFTATLTVIVLAIDVAMLGLFKGLDYLETRNEPYVSPVALPAGRPFPAPGLQETPWTDLKKFRAEQESHLHGYGWVDEPAGLARVPISRAKEMLLKQGLPVRPELADALEGTHVASGGESNGGRSLPAGMADTSVQPQTAVPPAPPATAVPAAPPAVPKGPGGGHD